MDSFYGMDKHGNKCIENRTKRQSLRYKNTYEIDWAYSKYWMRYKV